MVNYDTARQNFNFHWTDILYSPLFGII